MTCKFYYNEYITAEIYHLEPRTIASGSNVSFWGLHRAGNLSQIYNMKIGDFGCKVYNATPVNISSLNTTNSSNSSTAGSGNNTTNPESRQNNSKTSPIQYSPWSFSPLNCTSDLYQTAGIYNVSEWTYYGYANKIGSSIYSVQQGKPYDIMVVPTIT